MKAISFENLRGLTKTQGGLDQSEVSSQQTRFGFNNIVEVSGHPFLELIVDTLKDPMIWFLIVIGSIFLFMGQTTDGLTLLGAVLPLLFMDAFLHWRTQASTASLKSQLSSRVFVRRQSTKIQIDSRDLVPGDIVIIEPGTLLPADGLFEITHEIQVDESTLTGESLPVTKKATILDPFKLSTLDIVKVPAENLGYAGTRVLMGQGELRVLFTGVSTSYGEIVQSVSRMPHELTPLQNSIGKLVRTLIFGAALFCLILAVVRIYQGHGWLDALLSASTLAIAAIPEEFPVVFTFFLGVGIYRLAKKRALVRRAVSVENIGRVTQICTDKTGTITVGHLKLTHTESVFDNENSLLNIAWVASSTDTDPVDMAIIELAQQNAIQKPQIVKTVPFTEDRKRETGFFKNTDEIYWACVKGAPETILSLSNLTLDQSSHWKLRITEYAKAGHKVIAVAQKKMEDSSLNIEPKDNFEFCGLLAFEDPVRPEVAEAMSYCRASGIRVLMITGDHPDTSAAIAKDAGMTLKEPVVLSAQDDPARLSEEWLYQNPEYLKNLDVVARCTPMQKLTIVKALKQSGEIVAVTGDGVNDVPALKAADIGIAMGERGTRSAKEVSSIILADDNFSTIINAIREGRQLFINLKMSFQYLLLIHIPLVLTAAIIPLSGYPLVYLPIHIVWLELIIHPTAMLAFQSSATDNLVAVHRQRNFFSNLEVTHFLLLGTALTVAITWIFVFHFNESSNIEHARALVLAILAIWSGVVTLSLTQFKSITAMILTGSTVLITLVLIQMSQSLGFLHLAPLKSFDGILIGALSLLFLFSLKISQLLEIKKNTQKGN